MNRPKRKMTRSNLESWTLRSKERMQSIMDLADKLRHDPEKHNRMQACLCPMCYYGSRLGGQAVTTEPCMCCGEEQMYSSTATDALCRPCAQETGLCKHCGGDRELRVRRKKWPEPKTEGCTD